jgi:methylmalonyl-CoA mutase N-terminal domain/subunit
MDLETLGARQIERLARWREERDASATEAALDRLAAAARGTDNLVPVIRDACRVGATVGEIADVLRGTFGEYHDPAGR